MTSSFSESRVFGRNFNLYARSVYAQEELPYGFRNTFLMSLSFASGAQSRKFDAVSQVQSPTLARPYSRRGACPKGAKKVKCPA